MAAEKKNHKGIQNDSFLLLDRRKPTNLQYVTRSACFTQLGDQRDKVTTPSSSMHNETRAGRVTSSARVVLLILCEKLGMPTETLHVGPRQLSTKPVLPSKWLTLSRLTLETCGENRDPAKHSCSSPQIRPTFPPSQTPGRFQNCPIDKRPTHPKKSLTPE